MRRTRIRSRESAKAQADERVSYARPNTPAWGDGRLYAIAFDLDTDALKRLYPGSYHQNAYDDIRRLFELHGFERQQGSVYFGNKGTTSVQCVLAVQDASRRYSWFRHVVRDIRMLRIEEHNDLGPALGEPELPFDPQPTRPLVAT